ncbi:MAG: hypothetical protein L3J12_08070, partial [Spirochaetales bacterium]|nr:hypothetical protein [Spirochaetales bacterium]
YKLNTQIEEFIYRIVQEGISNVIRHSYPNKIEINLTYQEDGLNLLIINDGVKQEEIDPGFGLSHIKEKIEELSGLFQYYINSEKEFILRIFIPQVRRAS